MAREKASFFADAPDVLKQYHKAVLDKSMSIPGRDLAAKAAAVRVRMRQIEPSIRRST